MGRQKKKVKRLGMAVPLEQMQALWRLGGHAVPSKRKYTRKAKHKGEPE
jgi:hypothetical protein